MWILYRFLIVCICFEEIFSRIVFPLKICKYILVIQILLMVLYKRKMNVVFPFKAWPEKLFLIVTSVSVVISIPFFMDYGWVGLDVPKKYLFFPILVICFYYAPFFNCNVGKLTFFYARIIILYSLLNPILYFLHLPIWNGVGYWGRISVGYPTVDVVAYAIGLAIILFDEYSHVWSWKKQSLAAFFLIVGILSQASGTGIVLVFVIFVFMIMYIFFFKEKRQVALQKKKLCLIVLLLSISAPIGYGALLSLNPDLLKKMEWHFENRTRILLNGGNALDDVNTVDMRKDEFQNAKDVYLKDFSSVLFGAGFGPLDYSSKRNVGNDKQKVFLESQFHLTMFSSGVVGLIVLLGTFVVAMKKIVMKKNILMFVVGSCFLVSFGTTNPLMSFSLTGILALCYTRFFMIRDNSGDH